MKFKLYLEGIKQLRVIGIMALVIFSLEAVFVGIQQGITPIFEDSSYAYRIMTLFDIHPISVLSFSILAPIMTLYIFGFLNKRNSCDFYHAAPVSRKKLFLSYYISVITWILVILIISTLVAYITSLFFPDSYRIQISGAIMVLLSNFAASILVVSAISLGMCITGTIFTNILVSLMIIFIPRLFISLIQAMISSSLPMVSGGSVISILELKYNIVCSSVFSVFLDTNQISNSFHEPGSCIYTLILGIIYGISAYLLFINRKSEAAGLSAPNNILQTVYRIIIALTICLIPISIFYRFLMNDYEIEPSTILVIIVSYLSSIIMVIVFELISTRKVRNILKIFPSLGIVFVLNFIIFFSMFGVKNAVLNTTPDGNDIKYVNILSMGNNLYYGEYNYFDVKKSEVNITDEKIKNIISDTLKENISLYKSSPDSYYSFISSAKTGIIVTIKEGNLKYDRLIYINNENYEKLLNELDKNEDFTNIYKNLPDINDENLVTIYDEFNLDEEAIASIYNTMREEISTMSLKELDFLMNPYMNEIYTTVNYVEINSLFFETSYNGKSCTAYLPINSFLPKTTAEYFKQIKSENKENFNTFIDLIDDFKDNEYQLDVYIETTNMEDNLTEKVYTYYWYDSTNNNIKENMLSEFHECLEVLKLTEGVPADINEKFMKITVSYYDNKDQYKTLCFYSVPKSQEEIEKIMNFLNDFLDNDVYTY